MQDQMKLWQLSEFGRDNLVLATGAVPAPGTTDLLVKVSAVSLNYRDKLVVEGQLLPDKPVMPFVPVSDMAGEVVAIGPGITRFKVGDRVSGNFWTQWIDGPPPPEMRHHGLSLGGPLPGMLAEYVVLPEAVAVKAPSSLTDAEVSTLPIAALTAWFALVEMGGIAAGQTVLVQGTGGVALFGMQIARAFGANVIVTSRDDAKLERAKALGASNTINTDTTRNWAVPALAMTGGRGVDHVIELIGGDNLRESVEALAIGGRIAQVGFLGSMEITLPAVGLMLRRATIQGISVGHRAGFETMNRVIDAFGIKPIIEKIYGFDDVHAAFAHLDRGPFGKIVISLNH